MPFQHVDAVVQRLWQQLPDQEPAHVFAILDGARDERIHPTLLQSANEHCCLYRGDLEPDLTAAAPYLVQLQPEGAFTTWLVSYGWGDSWGVFLQSAASLPELRRHFRRFLMVYDPDGQPMYFRYYDPRVLRVYLPTCNASELRIIFGPVLRYCLEAEDPNSLLEIEFRRGKLGTRVLPLVSPQRVSV